MTGVSVRAALALVECILLSSIPFRELSVVWSYRWWKNRIYHRSFVIRVIPTRADIPDSVKIPTFHNLLPIGVSTSD